MTCVGYRHLNGSFTYTAWTNIDGAIVASNGDEPRVARERAAASVLNQRPTRPPRELGRSSFVTLAKRWSSK